jgi:hypothetical protein
MQYTKICHVKGGSKLFLQSKNEINGIANNDNAINIYNKHQGVFIVIEFKHDVIRFTTFETKSKKEIVDLSIKRFGSLLQTIKRLIE